ncbi:g10190 [Coccomyxa viridis]|uniref:G10190 protein n=1 Tax=Coccomyxa viridis TaxID=1274662 RepID=A0ABP1G7B1_9CHLO
MVTSEELFSKARAKSAAAEVLRIKARDDRFDEKKSDAKKKEKEAQNTSEEALALRKRGFSLLQEEHTGCPGSTYKQLPPQAFYRLLQDLLPTPWECAASDGQREIANEITEHLGGQLDWFGHHGPPLQTLCEGFAEFSDQKDYVNPQEPDYNAAWTMVDRASQVGLDEVNQLQPDILGIFRNWLGHKITFTPCWPGEEQPNIVGRVGQHTVVMVKLYADKGVHTRAAVLRHYQDFLASQDLTSGLLQQSCMPVLGMEIDNATLSVTGLAAIECTLLSEPLMHGLQLYRSNDPQHMLALATAMAAIRLTLDSLAAEQKRAGSCLNRPQQWPGRPWPLSQGKYESWRIQKLYGNTTYLLQPPEEATGSQSARLPTASPQPVPLVAKFWQPQGGHAVADLVQAAWHKQGVAPEVVDTFKVKPPPTFAPADDGDWEALKVEALQALRKGHEAQLMAPPDIMLAGEEAPCTVHANARLVNTMARRGPSGWEINFVGFACSGIQGSSRYPIMMSSDVRRQFGAHSLAHLEQQHDDNLLTAELEQGRAP